MKNLTTAHYSVKQSLMSELINGASSSNNSVYTNTKISLLNNAIVFPVPAEFKIDIFTAKLTEYLNQDLKADTAVERVGDDIFFLPFSTIVLIKKAVVYHLVDNHLYVNVVPVKEMQTANYKEGAISGFLSQGKSDKIFEFVENYVMSQFYAQGIDSVRPYGRYFLTGSMGLSTILASHMEPGEKILAKLDIHKIEQSTSGITTTEKDEAFYLCTTNGSYLIVLDDNLQEKYIENLSEQEMKITTKLTRDLVSCGFTQWLCTRDNNKLFAEVSPLSNKTADEKLNCFAQLHFNNAEEPADKIQAADMLHLYAKLNNNSPFANFEASLIEYSARLHQTSPDVSEESVAVKLMESANSLLSESDFEGKLKVFLSQYKFTSQELLALIFVISRAKNRIADTKIFASVMSDLKARYYKMDSDSLNRAFVSLSIAKKLNMIGEREAAAVFAAEAYDNAGHNYASLMAPGLDTLPTDPATGDSITYEAATELYKSAITDSDRLKHAMTMAELKPLIKSNLDNVLKYSTNNAINSRYTSAITVFDAESFANYSYMMGSEIDGKFSKLSSSYMPSSTDWRKPYSGFKSWAQKAQPDSSISSIKQYGTLVDTNNFHLLYSLGEQLSRYFDIQGVEMYVLAGRNQGVVSNDDGETKYIYIDQELLDVNNPNYMNASELTFMLAREYAALKIGISRLTCHPQWRRYSKLGVMNIDAIQGFANDADFISKISESYNRVMLYNKLISTPGYFNFDVEDVAHASLMLADTLSTVEYQGSEKISDIKEREYAALSLLSAQILDRVGLMITGNVVYAIKAIIHNEQQVTAAGEFAKDNTVAMYATMLNADGKPANYDFAMRLDSLLSFYVSADYKKY